MKKILVIRFSSIGDIVLCTPVFRVLKKRFPEAEITFLTKSKFSQILENNPHLASILSWDKPEDRAELFSKEFDAVVDLHSNLRSRLVKMRFWQVPNVTVKKKNIYKLLYTLTKWNGFKVNSIVDRSIEILYPWGIKNDNEGLDFNSTPLTAELLRFDAFMVVVLGGTYATKRIPENKLEELFAKLQKIKVVLIGGTEEKEMGARLEAKFGGQVQSMCGKLGIKESAEVIRLSQVVVSGDTGMAHIAAAMGKPLGLIWGNTGSGYGMSPVVKQGIELKQFEVNELSCWPCSKLGYGACPKGHFKCMQAQKMDEVGKFVEKYL